MPTIYIALIIVFTLEFVNLQSHHWPTYTHNKSAKLIEHAQWGVTPMGLNYNLCHYQLKTKGQ